MALMSGVTSIALAQGPKADASKPKSLEDFKALITGTWAGQNPHKGWRMHIASDEIRWYQDIQDLHEPLTENDEKIMVDGTAYHLVFAVKFAFVGGGQYMRPDPKTIRRGVKTAQASENYKIEYVGPDAVKIIPTATHLQAGDAVNFKKDGAFGGLTGGESNVDLTRGVKYYSNNGQYYFEWQPDGNFVVKKTANGEFRWGMNLVRKDFSYIKILRLQPDGNFVARGGEAKGDFMWGAINFNPGPSSLVATDGGKLELRHIASKKVLWTVP
ncbi:MAG: hypothetical protein R2762_20680 [Bryobacteraceae bacterium]